MRAAILALALPALCQAQAERPITSIGLWSAAPSVTIVSREADPRLQFTREAVEFWNRTFAELGTPFRLGPVTRTVGPVPGDELERMSEAGLRRQGPLPMPESVRQIPGDLIIALSDAEFVSFTARWPSQQKALVAIKTDSSWPLSLPNVARNLIAHEIGHALGLGHNNDPAMLMCGRPAPCRPDSFRSDTDRFFPLTIDERTRLRKMYSSAPTVTTVGWLDSGSALRRNWAQSAFGEGLRERGWLEGQNIVVERRYADGKEDRLPALAAELVRLNVGVLIAGDSAAIPAAIAATGKIPIVIIVSGDPVRRGFVASLARPGGNVTGLTNISAELAPKRVQLLREMLPRMSRLAIIGPREHLDWKPLAAAAELSGLRLQALEVGYSFELAGAFEAARRDGADAVIVLPAPLTNRHANEVIVAAASSRLPTMYALREVAAAGGLIAYGPSIPELYRRAAGYVDKLLKGAKPGDLPVEQPMKFELVVNLKTATALGIRVPDTLLLQADEVLR